MAGKKSVVYEERGSGVKLRREESEGYARIANMDNKERNEVILNLTCELLEKMNFQIEKAFVEDMPAETNEEGETSSQVLVSVSVSNPGALIGIRGRNLAAMQTVLALMVKAKFGEWVRLLLDINNYRDEQKERLQGMCRNLAEKVLQTGKPVALASMSSYERRICHMTLKAIEGITSESEGEGEDRHVVIKLVEQ